MAKARDIIIAIVIGGSFLLFGLLLFAMITFSDYGDGGFPSLGDKVAIVNVNGIIESSTEVVRQLDRWGSDNSVRAIVLHLNSPGGGVAASQEIYEKVLKVKRETEKPVVASMSSVCASGGYYIACAADRIVANQGTVTGSIGVILQYPVIDNMMEKIGLQYQTVKSGASKDIGSPFRQPNRSDSLVFQALVDDSYEQFVEAIVANRPLEESEVRRIADGSVYTGRQALNLGLVDTLGTFEDAVDIAGEMSGLGTNPNRVREIPRRQTTVFDFFGKLIGLDLSDILERRSELLYPQLRYIFN